MRIVYSLVSPLSVSLASQAEPVIAEPCKNRRRTTNSQPLTDVQLSTIARMTYHARIDEHASMTRISTNKDELFFVENRVAASTAMMVTTKRHYRLSASAGRRVYVPKRKPDANRHLPKPGTRLRTFNSFVVPLVINSLHDGERIQMVGRTVSCRVRP